MNKQTEVKEEKGERVMDWEAWRCRRTLRNMIKNRRRVCPLDDPDVLQVIMTSAICQVKKSYNSYQWMQRWVFFLWPFEPVLACLLVFQLSNMPVTLSPIRDLGHAQWLFLVHYSNLDTCQRKFFFVNLAVCRKILWLSRNIPFSVQFP